MLTRQYTTSIFCKYTGEVSLSTRPASHQQFRQRGRNEAFDRPGGGADMKCNYTVVIKRIYFEAAMHILEDNVPRHELDDRLFA